jgi:hypothetical protein
MVRSEPIQRSRRPTEDMTHPSADHERHDPLLIAAYADDELGGEERLAAEELVRNCESCAGLAADLRAIAAATAVLPAPARPRDFRLSPADAERLRRRRFGGLGAALLGRTGPGQPIAVALTTLGLAGLLIGTAPGLLTGGSAASLSKVGGPISEPAAGAAGGASEPYGNAQGAPAASAAASSAPVEAPTASGQPVPAGSSTGSTAYGTVATPQPSASAIADSLLGIGKTGSASPEQRVPAAAGPGGSRESAGAGDLSLGPLLSAGDATGSGPSPLLLVSLGSLALGLALFALRRIRNRTPTR